MTWYYTIDGRQLGPLDDAALDQSVAEGVITPDTFVWKEGLAQWTPLRQVERHAAVVSTASSSAETCSICGKPVGADNLIELLGQRVCAACKPATVQSLREGVVPASISSAWRDGKKVVTHDKAELPPRCFQCNQPAPGQPLTRKLRRSSPVVTFVIFGAVFLSRSLRSHTNPALQLAVAAALVGLVIAPRFLAKRASVDIHLCDRHLQWRRYLHLTSWCAIGVTGVMFITAIVTRMNSLFFFVPFAIFIATMSRVFVPPRVQATRIKDNTIWLVGAGKSFLASLPTWPG
jgi:hypothetical protein